MSARLTARRWSRRVLVECVKHESCDVFTISIAGARKLAQELQRAAADAEGRAALLAAEKLVARRPDTSPTTIALLGSRARTAAAQARLRRLAVAVRHLHRRGTVGGA